jgi:hypothetical protein
MNAIRSCRRFSTLSHLRSNRIQSQSARKKGFTRIVACLCIGIYRRNHPYMCRGGCMRVCSFLVSVICREGRRSSDSILNIREAEHFTFIARSCCVKSRDLRLRLTQFPNEYSTTTLFLCKSPEEWDYCTPFCQVFCAGRFATVRQQLRKACSTRKSFYVPLNSAGAGIHRGDQHKVVTINSWFCLTELL